MVFSLGIDDLVLAKLSIVSVGVLPSEMRAGVDGELPLFSWLGVTAENTLDASAFILFLVGGARGN